MRDETTVELDEPALVVANPDGTAATAESLPPELASRPSAGSREGTGQGTVTNPREALLLDEVRRTRLVAGMTSVLTVLVIAALLPMDGDPVGKLVHLIGLGVALIGCVATMMLARDAAAYRVWMNTLFSVCGSLALATAFYFWGVFSSAVLVVPIAMYFFASCSSLQPTLPVVALSVVPHLVLGTLITFGVIADRGIIRPLKLSTFEALAALGIAQFVFFMAFVLARGHRKSSADAMEQLDRAARTIAQREALLLEAKQELERAMKVGGPGRYTDQRVGSFRLGNLLGRGAMGDVYEAVREDDGTPAAVKLLAASATADPRLVQRFMRELEIAGNLDAAGVVKVLETASPDASIPYLAMERLHGQTLADALRARARMQPDEALQMLAEVAAGIDAAHEEGIVHRDIKPRNIFAAQSGERVTWKLLDFGVSKLADGRGTLTQGQVVGTPAYMAPEQARGEAVDRRCDIYALGAIAYRVLTGRPAFSGKDTPTILYLVTHSMPPRPSSIAPLGDAFDPVLAVGIAKDPALRFESGRQLVDALRAARSGAIPDSTVERARQVLSTCPWGQVR